jgi:L-ascorbate metabolism protein UlaG (beta-lactamase superfamily)
VADNQVYLKQNVLAEPLFNQWYAWSHLISPANAAMYINNVHLKIMQSFVAAPQVHASAYKNPEMIGGPFMNYDASRMQEVKALLDKTIKEQAHMIAFAQALQSFEKTFVDESDGISLEAIYKQVPDALRGYVELVYDLNNQPSIRFIEGLLYRSPYYNAASQSLALSLVEADERAFVLSTPRLEDNTHVHVGLPFEHEGLDELFAMKFTPKSYERIKDMLQIRKADEARFASFFTTEPAQTAPRFDGEGVRVRYFGHACLLIESKNVAILTDPVISYKINSEIQRCTYADLPEAIDYGIITHNHQDHCMFECLLQLRHKIKTLVVPRTGGGALADPSLKLALQKIGFKNVIEIDEMESLEIPGGSITGLPFLGEHADLNIRAKLGYCIKLENRSIVAVADSNNIEPRLYDNIHRLISDVDLFFIGMECDGAPMSWIYGALLTRPMPRKFDQSRRLNGSNFEKARDILSRFNPSQAYVYAMGQEPWLNHIVAIKYTDQSVPIVESNKLVQWCRERGVESERLFGHKDILLNAN